MMPSAKFRALGLSISLRITSEPSLNMLGLPGKFLEGPQCKPKLIAEKCRLRMH